MRAGARRRRCLGGRAERRGRRRPGVPYSAAITPPVGRLLRWRDRRTAGPASGRSSRRRWETRRRGRSELASVRPRPAIAAYGSSRSPYISRLTNLCTLSRSGLEADGDDAGHDERDEKVAARRQRRTHQSDDGDIAGHDADGQRAVDERTIDDEVDLVEPVLENGNGDACGWREKRQHGQDLGAWDDAPQQGAHDKERHGEAERHAHPAQLLALVTVGPSVAHYECRRATHRARR